MIPDNLTPAEQQQLMQMAHREALLVHANAAFVPEVGEGEEPREALEEPSNVERAALATLPSPALPALIYLAVQLETGAGNWRGYDFTLTAEELKAVHKICAAAIAAKLTQEIERVRGDLD